MSSCNVDMEKLSELVALSPIYMFSQQLLTESQSAQDKYKCALARSNAQLSFASDRLESISDLQSQNNAHVALLSTTLGYLKKTLESEARGAGCPPPALVCSTDKNCGIADKCNLSIALCEAVTCVADYNCMFKPGLRCDPATSKCIPR